jgi:hypothetical protein
VLPDVEAQDRLLAFHDRRVLIRRALDRQLAAGVDEPRPAAAEAADAGLGELLLEGVEAAEGALIASATAPEGAPPAPGAISFQNIV